MKQRTKHKTATFTQLLPTISVYLSIVLSSLHFSPLPFFHSNILDVVSSESLKKARDSKTFRFLWVSKVAIHSNQSHTHTHLIHNFSVRFYGSPNGYSKCHLNEIYIYIYLSSKRSGSVLMDCDILVSFVNKIKVNS